MTLHSQVEGQQIPAEFTYSVTWRETTVPFEKRMDKYRRYQFLPQHLEARAQILFRNSSGVAFAGYPPEAPTLSLSIRISTRQP